ncbi:hypothetical protein AVEN_110694-1 [Araneus ventricosus]|uniref:Uncharacterized protein n=1 Tax=Araneus ventricosus TaxID=182803 RepID=A0A4Y2AV39_ARAVE|nr:hypothetical protein AVEN_110694-1 [Araneus ventricosus]
MLLSFNLVRGFAMYNSSAENALSASVDALEIVFKASPSFIIFDDRFSVVSNNCNSCFPILFKLELLLVEQPRFNSANMTHTLQEEKESEDSADNMELEVT